MTALSKTALLELILDYRPGMGLHSEFYLNEDIFAYESEAIFGMHWILAGHITQLTAGSYRSVTVGTESILLSMDKAGNVYGHYNVCRHRGCALASADITVAPKIVCPYHSWQYALDGKLMFARGMPDDFNLAAYSLKPCGIFIFEGLIFVNLSSTTDPRFDKAIEDARYFLGPLNIGHTKIAAGKTWDVHANWKLLVENFEECYHCLSIHPEYSRIMAHAVPESTGSKEQVQQWELNRDEWYRDLATKGLTHGWVAPSADQHHFCARVPFNKGIETQSIDGQLVSTLLGRRSQSDGGSTSFRVWPISFVIGCPDHIILVSFLPVTAQKSVVTATWLVDKDAREGTDFHSDKLTALWAVTIEQDNWAVELTQPRIASKGYEAGPFSESEEYSSLFVQWYLSRLKDNI
jgi:phenylpropionate dioxygenase-like ring-hydroxylating dioxygenase large terminal subunit